MTRHLVRGKDAERQARRHLEQQGLRLVETNYHCRSGEIDLIMRDRDSLVFVEVRYRKSSAFGSAIESVGHQKQRRLLAAADHYLQRHPVAVGCRFDVVGITGSDDGVRIDWIKDAFRSN